MSGSYTKLKLNGVPITINSKDGGYLATLLTNADGVSNRLFTAQEQVITAWVGDGEWEVEEEFEDIVDEDNEGGVSGVSENG